MKNYNYIKSIKPNIEDLTGGWMDNKECGLEPHFPQYNLDYGCSESFMLFRDLITDKNVEKLIKYFSQSPSFGDVSVQGFNDSGFNGEVGSRRTTLFNPELAKEISDVIFSEIDFLLDNFKTNPFTATDSFQNVEHEENVWEYIGLSPMLRYMVYSNGGQHYAHYDAGFIYPDPTIRSLKSVVIYLTTNESGGTRIIDDGQYSIKAKDRNFDDWSRPVDPTTDNVLFTSKPVKGNVLIFDHRVCHDVEEFLPLDPNEKRIIIRTDILYKLKQ